MTSSLRFPILLSIAAAIVTLLMKSGAYWLTGSVGLLSDAAESVVNLIAATAAPNAPPTWLITGTDPAGVAAAAAALSPSALANHFALAVSGQTHLPLPLAPTQ